MKFGKYIISILLMTNIFYVFSSNTNSFNFLWHLLTGVTGTVYLLHSIYSDCKKG